MPQLIILFSGRQKKRMVPELKGKKMEAEEEKEKNGLPIVTIRTVGGRINNVARAGQDEKKRRNAMGRLIKGEDRRESFYKHEERLLKKKE